MKIEISYHDIERTEAIDEHIESEIDHRLGRYADRITRVEVHVGDQNGAKKGPADKRCMLEIRPARSNPIAVEAHGEDLYSVISDAAKKGDRALTKKLEKAEAKVG